MQGPVWLHGLHTREASTAYLLLPLTAQPQCLPLTFMQPVSLHVPSSPGQSHTGLWRNNTLPCLTVSHSLSLGKFIFPPPPPPSSPPSRNMSCGLHHQRFWPNPSLLLRVLFLSWAAVVSPQLIPDLLDHLPVPSCLGWSSHTPLTSAQPFSISHHHSQGPFPFLPPWSPSFRPTKEFCLQLGNIPIPYHNPAQSCIGQLHFKDILYKKIHAPLCS